MLNRNNIEYEIDRMVESMDIVDYDVEMDVNTQGLVASSDMSVTINGQVVHSGYLSDGNHTLSKSITVPPGNKLVLSAHTSTHVHGQCTIVTGLRINKSNISKTNLWIMDGQIFTHENGEVEQRCNGLYHNGTWSLSMPTPLFPWIKSEKDKRSNIVYHDNLKFDISNDEYYQLLDKIFR